jgi:hypothetical protein
LVDPVAVALQPARAPDLVSLHGLRDPCPVAHQPPGTLLEWLDCEAMNPSTLIRFSSRRVLAPTTAHELTPHKLQKLDEANAILYFQIPMRRLADPTSGAKIPPSTPDLPHAQLDRTHSNLNFHFSSRKSTDLSLCTAPTAFHPNTAHHRLLNRVSKTPKNPPKKKPPQIIEHQKMGEKKMKTQQKNPQRESENREPRGGISHTQNRMPRRRNQEKLLATRAKQLKAILRPDPTDEGANAGNRVECRHPHSAKRPPHWTKSLPCPTHNTRASQAEANVSRDVSRDVSPGA